MQTMLLLSAILLGFLAFFEPCTIATHTLYSVRLHQANTKAGQLDLLRLWFSRTLLLIGLFISAVFVFDTPQWGAYTPSIILSVMAGVYLLSRLVYIPVPHLAFYKLIPGHSTFSPSIQLGLTLPACTLPLIMVVTGLVVTVDNPLSAVAAGLLFAFGFTLPILVTASKGLNEKGKQLLNRAANTSPYLTALLLLSFALYLLLPEIESKANLLEQSLQTASLTGILIAFLAGFIFSFNPVSFASVPVMLAYVTKSKEPRRALWLAAAFILGTITTHVVLGVAAALGGDWVKSIMGREWGLVLGPILILMGFMWAGWLNIRLPWFGMKGHRVNDFGGAFLLGIPFSIAICPFCTPALMVALTASAAIGSVGFGAALLLAFAIGRSIPVALGAWGMEWLENLRFFNRHHKGFEIAAGLVLILSGIYLINEYFLLMRF